MTINNSNAPTWEAIMFAEWDLVNIDRGQFYQYASDNFDGQLEVEFADANSAFTRDWGYISWATYRDDTGVIARWDRPVGRQ